ncbi:hypothetical protein RA989_21610, partial [Mycobacteroides abscessus subsp. massiliense]
AWALSSTGSWRLMLGLAAVPAALVLIALLNGPAASTQLYVTTRCAETPPTGVPSASQCANSWRCRIIGNP